MNDASKKETVKERVNIRNKNVPFNLKISFNYVRCESHSHIAQTQRESFSQESWGGAGETARKPLSPTETRLLHLSKGRSLQKALSAGSRHSHSSYEKCTVTALNVNKP